MIMFMLPKSSVMIMMKVVMVMMVMMVVMVIIMVVVMVMQLSPTRHECVVAGQLSTRSSIHPLTHQEAINPDNTLTMIMAVMTMTMTMAIMMIMMMMATMIIIASDAPVSPLHFDVHPGRSEDTV